MTATDVSLLRQPAGRAVRVVALSLLHDARHEAQRLRDAATRDSAPDSAPDRADDDDDTLHDFRVAVRRLRSWLRAAEPWLADSVSRKVLKRVRRIGRATGPARDADVHLAWLAEQRGELRGRRRAGLTWMMDSIASDGDAARDDAVDAAGDFDAVSDKLSRQLEAYTVVVGPDAHADPPFATAMAGLIRDHADLLERRLASVRAYADERDAHRARIAAKRLRYLVDAVPGADGESKAVVAALKELQDSLGDLHDVHVFAEQIAGAAAKCASRQARQRITDVVLAEGNDGTAPRRRASDRGPGLMAIARLLRERGEQAFHAVEHDWLGEGKTAATFFARVRSWTECLASGGADGAADAAGPAADASP